MGRLSAMVRSGFIFIVVSLVAALTGCSSSSPTTNTTFPVPANIVLAPANTVSLDVGSANQIFTASPRNAKNTAITTPVTFLSSNTAILTIASNGLACAGTWDSITTPQICTPGPVGVAQVTATSHGISSPPTTGYVHQHIDKIVINPVPGQTLPAVTAFRRTAFNHQATATSGALDITASVGPFAGSPSTPQSPHSPCLQHHSRTRLGGGRGSGRRQCAGTDFPVCQQQQRHQSASRFRHLPGAINYAGGRRRQLQQHQRDLGNSKDFDRNRAGYAGQYHHRLTLDLEFVESGRWR